MTSLRHFESFFWEFFDVKLCSSFVTVVQTCEASIQVTRERKARKARKHSRNSPSEHLTTYHPRLMLRLSCRGCCDRNCATLHYCPHPSRRCGGGTNVLHGRKTTRAHPLLAKSLTR